MAGLKRSIKNVVKAAVYPIYERRLSDLLNRQKVPQHVGVILDGNRRWARNAGAESEIGHAAGARKIVELLEWCEEFNIPHVTLWLLSTDNFSRSEREITLLLNIIDRTVAELASQQRWKLNLVGALDVLPNDLQERLMQACVTTEDISGITVNVAIGYGGRREISDAVKSLLTAHAADGKSLIEVAEMLTPDHITEHLYTKGLPDPDLVIRTSGEQRLGGFLLWQSVHSEFYFCEAFWPDFRRIDFLRALRAFAQRSRRFGA
jgi:short-chain Z-isoprenyl diphosphate synthase